MRRTLRRAVRSLPWRGLMKKKMIVIAAIAAVIVMGGVGWYVYAHSAPAITLRTATVERGDLQATISATGTLQARDGPTDVSAQVNGPIIGFGWDPLDVP